jgi:hypothetical protein
MATDYITQVIGIFRAAEDLTDHQYKVVQLNSLNTEVLWQKPSLSGTPQGVLTNAPRAGQAALVQVFGIAKVTLGGTAPIMAGRGVGTLEDGTVIEGGSFGTTVSAGSPGDIIEILLGGSASSSESFSWETVLPNRQVKVPKFQQMTVHLNCGEQYIIEGDLLLDGDLILES